MPSIGRPAPGHASANLNIDINSRSAWKREAVPLRRDWPDRRHRSRSVDDIAPSQCWPRCPPKYPDRRRRRAGPAGPASRSHAGKIRQFALVRSADHDGCLIRRSLRFLHARSLPIPLPRSKLHRAKSKRDIGASTRWASWTCGSGWPSSRRRVSCGGSPPRSTGTARSEPSPGACSRSAGLPCCSRISRVTATAVAPSCS